jgi:uracil-DNA glycosylase
LSEELNIIHSQVLQCTRCELHKGRTRAVPGEGLANAKVMFVGEGPGENEDREGRPFVGAAGKLLTELLSSIEVDRDSVFITNIVKCRPPGNRAPRQAEIDACRSYLESQIRLIDPKIICPLGGPAIKTLMGPEYSVSQSHGKTYQLKGRTMLPLYHPAAALYDASLKDVMLEDIKKLKELISETSTRGPEGTDGPEPLQKWL